MVDWHRRSKILLSATTSASLLALPLCLCSVVVLCITRGQGVWMPSSHSSRAVLLGGMEERADGGGLQVQEKSLGWGSLLAGSGQARRRRREGTRGWWGDQGGQEGYKRRDADITARLAALGRGNSLEAGAQMNTYFSNGLRRGMSALSAGGKGIGGYEVIAKIGQQLAPDVMSRLSSYVPLAIGEQEQLTDAISRRKRNLASGIEANLSANSRRFPRKSQLQVLSVLTLHLCPCFSFCFCTSRTRLKRKS